MRRWWVRAAISATVAAVLLSFVPVGEVWRAIRGVSLRIWLAAVAIFVGGHSLNAMKLRLLIGPHAASAVSCLQAHFAGIAANLGLPGVAGGDVVRAAYLAPAAGGPRVVAAAVADRVVDLTVVLLIVAVAAPVAGVPELMSGSLRGAVRWAAIVVAAVVLIALLVRRRIRRTGTLPRLQAALSGIFERPAALVGAMLISLGVQSLFVLTNAWLGSEVGLTMAIAPWFLAWTAARLAAVAPISVGGIGVREATLVSVLAAYGAAPDRALAVGLLWEGAIVVGGAGGFVVTQAARRSR